MRRVAGGHTNQSMMTRLPSLVAAVACVVLIVLAALRWPENEWGALVWLGAFVLVVAIRAPHALRNRANAIVAARRDATDNVLLLALLLLGMVLPLLQIATHALAFADYALPQWATATGAVMQVPGVWLYWRSHADLGLNWSPSLEMRQDHGLVTNGIYRGIRHPMYASMWLLSLSQPLLIHNWLAGALVVPVFAAMWFLRVPREEAMMRDRFGADYEAYSLRAGRLFPKLGR
jgi:protein-S-isoprenylcysteine O-methyltransferase Ste14